MKALTKTTTWIILSMAALLLSCEREKNDNLEIISKEKKAILTLTMPSEDAQTRVGLEREKGTKNILVKWRNQDKISLFFQQGNVIKDKEVAVKTVSEDGKTATFDIVLPDGISSGKFTLYATHGMKAKISAQKILADVSPSAFNDISQTPKIIPMMFKAENVDAGNPNVTGTFAQLGSLIAVNVKNTSSSLLSVQKASLSFTGEKWYYDVTSGNSPIPYYNLLTGSVEYGAGTPSEQVPSSLMNIHPGWKNSIVQWIMPKPKSAPQINLVLKTSDNEITSVNAKPARTASMQAGKAYHLYALWDGANLTFKDSELQLEDRITLTTAKSIGETIKLHLIPYNIDACWVDLNNNGIRDEGEGAQNNKEVEYTLQATTFSVYGAVWFFTCINSKLTGLDLSGTTTLTWLRCYSNEINVLTGLEKQLNLEQFDISNNKLTSIDVSMNKKLKDLNCGSNQLSSLNLQENILLEGLNCGYNKNISQLDVSAGTKLKWIGCTDNKITSLVIGNQPELEGISCGTNQLAVLDLSAYSKLKQITCETNRLTTLKLPENNEIAYLNCSGNKLTSLNLSKQTKLVTLYAQYNALTSLSISPSNNVISSILVQRNKLNTAQMTALFNNIPNTSNGVFYAYTEMAGEENAIPTNAQLITADNKKWKVYKELTNGGVIQLKPVQNPDGSGNGGSSDFGGENY